MSFSHKSVLLWECIDGLSIRPNGVYVDGTTGGAGHSSEIAKKLSSGGTLVCFDKDPDAMIASRKKLAGISDAKILFVESDFVNLKRELQTLELKQIDGLLLDLGVSSHQLDTAERGFSYHTNAPLDMRMSQSGLSAYDIVNTYPESELSQIFFSYGEEKYARSIAKSIVKERALAPIETTLSLVDIIKKSMPEKAKRERNPARKVFQALRIAVNDELSILDQTLEDAFSMLNSGGRLVVITFHSLEDRIVKRKFLKLVGGCDCPPSAPICICGKTEMAKRITRKPILASEEELLENRRSRSAKLRILEKL